MDPTTCLPPSYHYSASAAAVFFESSYFTHDQNSVSLLILHPFPLLVILLVIPPLPVPNPLLVSLLLLIPLQHLLLGLLPLPVSRILLVPLLVAVMLLLQKRELIPKPFMQKGTTK